MNTKPDSTQVTAHDGAGGTLWTTVAGFIAWIRNNTVSIDGGQTISGVKTFTEEINGTIVNGVYTSGNQTISGVKSFLNDVRIAGPSGLIGYGQGSGGTVTQTGSKSTNVTLQRGSGRVITHNQSLAANASADFAVVNSLVGTDDVVLCNPVDTDKYDVRVQYIITSAGFVLRVRNTTGAALSEQVNINFVIIRGSSL
jgi:hypothetical protein